MNIQKITPLTFTGFYRPYNKARFLEKEPVPQPTPAPDEFIKTENNKPAV